MEFRSNAEFTGAVRKLIEQWCDHRKLAALSRILPGYLAFNGMKDGWAELANSLKSVRALGADSFNEVEWKMLNDLIHAADAALSRTSPEESKEDIIAPGDLLSSLARYVGVARQTLDISQEEAIRRTEGGDGGRVALERLIRTLRDTQTFPATFYYAKFHTDEEGEIDSVHHGWCFDFFANLNGSEVNLLQALRFGDTKEGTLSAFFVSVILPTIGAYWHGLYDRDYRFIQSQRELSQALSGGRLKQATDEINAILEIPAGLRIRSADGIRSGKCLCLSETDGLLDIQFTISAAGQASEAVRTIRLEPRNRTFY